MFDTRNDINDSREIEEEIESLESDRGDLEEALESAEEALTEAKEAFDEADAIDQHNGVDPSGELAAAIETARKELADWDEDNGEELATLKKFRTEFSDYCDDWEHGVTIIRESYFAEYCEDLLKEIDVLPQDLPDYLVIDWDATAENLKVDYTEAEIDGVTYLAR